MQMKKILGILLAVCFLMSVTAAAVSAKTDKEWNKPEQKEHKEWNKPEQKEHKEWNKPEHKEHKEWKKVLHHKDNHHKFDYYTYEWVLVVVPVYY
jgi:Ni/Co efflux regulator RcnB